MSESVGARLRRNTRAGMITWAWGQVVMMVRLAIYYKFLGEEGYGLWFLAFSIMSYFVFYNFGINNAFIKYTAEYHAKKDYRELSHILSTGMAAAVAMGIGIVIVLFLFTDRVIAFFDFEPDNVADAAFVVKGVGVVTAFTVGCGVYNSVLIGIQRLDVLNIARVAFLTVEVVVATTLLFAGFGIRMLVFTYGAGMLFSYLAMAGFVWHYVPDLRLNPLHARRRCVPAMLSLGGRMQLLGAVALFVATVDGIVFAKLGGLAFLGVYAIARRVATRAQGAALQAFGALTPASADLLARKDYEGLSRVYGTALRICCLGCVYLFGFMAVNSDYTMLFFQGDQYNPLSAGALTFLSAALAIHTLTGPGTSMLRGAGWTVQEITYQLATLAFFLAAAFLAHHYGADDQTVVLTYPLAVSVGSLLFVVIANRFFRVPLLTPLSNAAPRKTGDKRGWTLWTVWTIWTRGMLLLIMAGPALAWAVRLAWDAMHLDLPFTRWWAIVVLLILGLPYTGLFALAAWFLPGLTAHDKAQIVKFVPGAHRLVGRYLPSA